MLLPREASSRQGKREDARGMWRGFSRDVSYRARRIGGFGNGTRSGRYDVGLEEHRDSACDVNLLTNLPVFSHAVTSNRYISYDC